MIRALEAVPAGEPAACPCCGRAALSFEAALAAASKVREEFDQLTAEMRANNVRLGAFLGHDKR